MEIRDNEIVVDYISNEFQLRMKDVGEENYETLMSATIEDIERWPESSRSTLRYFQQIDILKESNEAEITLFLIITHSGFIEPFINGLVIDLESTEDWGIIKENCMEQEFVNSATTVIVNSLFLKDNWKKMMDKILAVLKSTVDESIDNHIAHVVSDLRKVINVPPVIIYINDIVFNLKWTCINQKTNNDKWPLKLHEFYSESIEYLKTKHQFTPTYRPQKNISIGTQEGLSFESLLKPEYIPYSDRFIQILRDVTPELITIDGEWTGPKNAANVFYISMVDQGVMIKKSREVVHEAFDVKFGTGRSFVVTPSKNGKQTKAEEQYKSEFIERIDLLKKELG